MDLNPALNLIYVRVAIYTDNVPHRHRNSGLRGFSRWHNLIIKHAPRRVEQKHESVDSAWRTDIRISERADVEVVIPTTPLFQTVLREKQGLIRRMTSLALLICLIEINPAGRVLSFHQMSLSTTNPLLAEAIYMLILIRIRAVGIVLN
jgi:hypothetical protein